MKDVGMAMSNGHPQQGSATRSPMAEATLLRAIRPRFHEVKTE